MRTATVAIVLLGGLAGLVGGYAIGRGTAPHPWVEERNRLCNQRWELAKQVSAKRGVMKGYRDPRAWRPGGSIAAKATSGPATSRPGER
jgi:hypothetical protein